ncbi:MAG: hypothetical protein IJ560_03085 [Alphaproteobacteria bacterium]|nr:hypothetical protein [Alphaproteobacteria bacterium]
MKKLLAFVSVLGLCACGGYIKNQNGSEYLTQLDAEPSGCTFLYKLESEASVYDADDARVYLENRIADQARPGNAYLITSQRTKPNEWVMFGPERSFVLTANVYDCPRVGRVQPGTIYYDASPRDVVVAPVVDTPCGTPACTTTIYESSY